MKKAKINEINKYIKLDAWEIYKELFSNEINFYDKLNIDNKRLNKKLLDQKEIIIPNVKVAYISLDVSGLEGIILTFPVFAKFPTMTQKEFEMLERGEKLKEVFGITRGNLQWQLQNALSGLPLFDHCFPEVLCLDDINGERPIYNLLLGS